MKNTMQIYEENFNLQEIRTNYLQFITKINKNAKIWQLLSHEPMTS